MDIAHIAKLANLPIDSSAQAKLSAQFAETLKTVSQISQLNTQGILPTSQVTGLVNITREDKIDKSRILTQSQALSGAHQSHKGYFVVAAILNAN